MSTPLPTPPSPNAKIEELNVLHEILRDNNVNPDALCVVMLTATEMLIGEVENHNDYMENGTHASIFDYSTAVLLENPKRFSRLNMVDRSTGSLQVQMQFADFDMIEGGVIEVRPIAAFFLDWLDARSQTHYCRAYINFMDGKKRAKAEAAGVITSVGQPLKG